MKYLSLLLILCGFGLLSSCSKDSLSEAKVPQVVKDAFSKQYPDVKNEKWGKEDGNFSAEFMVGKMEMDAIYDAKGNLVATETEIDPATLPATITSYVSENFMGSSILEAERRNEGETVKYEVKVKLAGDTFDAYFDGAGNFLGKDLEDGNEEHGEEHGDEHEDEDDDNDED